MVVNESRKISRKRKNTGATIPRTYLLSYIPSVHAFIHWHAVDTFTAQNAHENTKPITITFAGLYLMLEKNFTGKEVQNAHIKMAKPRKTWLEFNLPKHKGDITIEDVIITPPSSMLDDAIFKWCASIWDDYTESHGKVAYICSN